ncbi:hypothetical protein ACJJTC_005438 [Scirpophaga incertulas]
MNLSITEKTSDQANYKGFKLSPWTTPLATSFESCRSGGLIQIRQTFIGTCLKYECEERQVIVADAARQGPGPGQRRDKLERSDNVTGVCPAALTANQISRRWRIVIKLNRACPDVAGFIVRVGLGCNGSER